MRNFSLRYIKRNKSPKLYAIPEYDQEYFRIKAIAGRIKIGLSAGLFADSEGEMYSFSDIENIVNTAIRKSIRKNVKITQGLLYEQVIKSKPSLTAEGLRKYFP